MELRELHYFVAVYEEGGVTAAAQRCFISQPSVSAALASIETELGSRLFTRHKRGVTPTAAAETLYPRAKALLADAAALRRLFTADEPRQALTLGLLRSLDIARTVALVAPVSAMPGIQLRLVGADEPADARIVEKRMAAEDEIFVPLWRERYVLALPTRHLLATGAPAGEADFKDLPFIARCHCENSAWWGGRGETLRIVAVADSEEWALALVGAGLGVTILPEGSVRGRPDIAVRPLANHTLAREIGIAYDRRATAAPRLVEAIARVHAGEAA